MLGYIYADRYDELQARAEASPWPDPDTLEDGVYAG